MKEKKDYTESFKYIGQVIRVTDSNDIEDGSTVLLMQHDDDCDTVFNIKENRVDSICDEYKFDVFTTPAKERLELMYDGLVSQVMTLTAEGWELNPDSFMDLTPWVGKLKIIQLLIENEPESI